MLSLADIDKNENKIWRCLTCGYEYFRYEKIDCPLCFSKYTFTINNACPVCEEEMLIMYLQLHVSVYTDMDIDTPFLPPKKVRPPASMIITNNILNPNDLDKIESNNIRGINSKNGILISRYYENARKSMDRKERKENLDVSIVYYCPNCKNVNIPDIDVSLELIQNNREIMRENMKKSPDLIRILEETGYFNHVQENWEKYCKANQEYSFIKLNIEGFMEKFAEHQSKMGMITLFRDTWANIIWLRIFEEGWKVYYTKFVEDMNENKRRIMKKKSMQSSPWGQIR